MCALEPLDNVARALWKNLTVQPGEEHCEKRLTGSSGASLEEHLPTGKPSVKTARGESQMGMKA